MKGGRFSICFNVNAWCIQITSHAVWYYDQDYFMPLLVLASCLYSCLSLLLLSNCTDQTFIRSITDDQTRTQRIPLGSANSFKSTRSYSLEIMTYCVKPIVQFWFHPPFILQANRKCLSPMIICLNSSSQRKRWLSQAIYPHSNCPGIS